MSGSSARVNCFFFVFCCCCCSVHLSLCMCSAMFAAAMAAMRSHICMDTMSRAFNIYMANDSEYK